MNRKFALVPAAGSGARFGAELPKQYLPLAGRPLIFHALSVLCGCAEIETVCVVLSPEDRFWPQHDWTALGGKLQTTFSGGATRAESVGAGLDVLAASAQDEDWILVHDAARPCLSAEMLRQLIDALQTDPVGGILAVPVADTLKFGNADGRIGRTVPRDNLWQAQTPQMFRYGILRRALAASRQVTDEAGAVEALGMAPRLVVGDSRNLKVTYPADLDMAERILRGQGQ